MPHPIRLAVAGVGNNISALYQGAAYYRKAEQQGILPSQFVGITRPTIGGIGVSDIEFVAAFDVHPNKVGKPFDEAVLAEPNNYPLLDVLRPSVKFQVEAGFSQAGEGDKTSARFLAIVKRLRDSNAEVLLYSLPTGMQWAVDAYAKAALEAGVAFVNCTPDSAARSTELLNAYEKANLPLIGDDLASHLGTSIVHRTLLGLLSERGITLASSYQLNFGGNEDFRNLRDHGGNKRESKINALAQEGVDTGNVEIIPSAGYVPHLKDNKVAILNIEGQGWAGTPVSLDIKLKVQDSSNAAGVIIDLIRIAAAGRRQKVGGFLAAATRRLKSPAGGHRHFTAEVIEQNFRQLDAAAS